MRFLLLLALISEFANAATVVTIRKDPTGHFRLAGYINGVSTYFLIDTGATTTSVPVAIANQAGLARQGCKPVSTSTANGITHGCKYQGRIAFGGIAVDGDILSLPNLSTSLLGMNVLRGLTVNQSGDFLTLTKGSPAPSSITISRNGVTETRRFGELDSAYTETKRHEYIAAPVFSDQNQREDRKAMKAQLISAREQLRTLIRRNLILPIDVMGNPTTTLRFVKLPSGIISDVEVVKPSGQTSYDRAIVNAIRVTSPLPVGIGTEMSFVISLSAFD